MQVFVFDIDGKRYFVEAESREEAREKLEEQL